MIDHEALEARARRLTARPDTMAAVLAAEQRADDDRGGWPTMHDDAYHGPVGDYVQAAAPHTEADPAAVLVQLLAGVGALANCGPYVLAGNDRHPAALFVAIAGATSSGAKGTSWSVARMPLAVIDPDFTAHRILGGFGSGEVLIETLAGTGDEDRPRDTRLLIHEGELGAILRVAGRPESTLGQRLRDAWDGRRLASRTRGRGTVEVLAGDYHLAAVAHITPEELRATLADTDTYGGTVNRLLWIGSRRARLLPDGGNVPDELAVRAGATLAENLAAARRHGRLDRTGDARKLWHDIYYELADDEPGGILGAAIARSKSQTMRLALTYALADGADAIDTDHLLAAVVAAGPDGITRRQIHALFGRHATAAQIDNAAAALIASGVATEDTERTGGRPRRLLKVAQT